ncbi:hypothetical protein CBR_g40863 [Chara braunii]|uniref:Uncharacterized protein n=1 Tax=Chara braunii TaxID=69332 RepID=A0A388K2I0_CHABU|nr:hypothetical protein CBR_g40863 [Chara braunii]|eukprot:GBG64163.1 hypothetical protein CBR_g40863 [Chara braunii]
MLGEFRGRPLRKGGGGGGGGEEKKNTKGGGGGEEEEEDEGKRWRRLHHGGQSSFTGNHDGEGFSTGQLDGDNDWQLDGEEQRRWAGFATAATTSEVRDGSDDKRGEELVEEPQRGKEIVCKHGVNMPAKFKFKLCLVAKGSKAGPKKMWKENFVCGALASLMSKVILQPFDMMKTILQGPAAVRGSYENIMDCMIGIARKQGPMGFYAGFVASVATSAPSSAVFFTTYEFVKQLLEDRTHSCEKRRGLVKCSSSSQWLPPMVGAVVGNMFASVVRVPPELVKQQVQAGIYSGLGEAVHHIWTTEGFRGFYRGYAVQVARDIPYAVVQFSIYEAFRRSFIAKQKAEKLHNSEIGLEQSNIIRTLWVGAIAGAAASILTTPIDVAKTRVMTQSISEPGPVRYVGARQAILQVWKEEGAVGLGRGMVPRVLYKVAASAVFLVAYETAKNIAHSLTNLASIIGNKEVEEAGQDCHSFWLHLSRN